MEKKKINQEDLHLNPTYSGEMTDSVANEKAGVTTAVVSREIKCPITNAEGCETTLNGCNSEVCPVQPSEDACPVTDAYCKVSEDGACEKTDIGCVGEVTKADPCVEPDPTYKTQAFC